MRKDRRGMAVMVDAMIFLVALTILSAAIVSVPQLGPSDDRGEILRSYHAVMLAGEIPGNGSGSMAAASLADYLMAVALGARAPNEGQIDLIRGMVNGTIVELERSAGTAWLVIEVGQSTLLFGTLPLENGRDVYADRRELGDGTVSSTLFLVR